MRNVRRVNNKGIFNFLNTADIFILDKLDVMLSFFRQPFAIIYRFL